MSIQKETLAIGDFMIRLRQFSDPFALALFGDDGSEEKLSDITRLADEIRLLKKEMKDLCASQLDAENIDSFFKKWNNMVFGVLYAEENYRKNGNISAQEMKILKTALEEIGEYCRSF
jgi:hypothetical protein